MLGSMAIGETRIENFATSEDCASTLRCLRSLGVDIRRDGTTVFIHGVGKIGFHTPSGPLHCGNSGTTMRLLAGLLAGQRFESILVGDSSLSRRPMLRVVEPLNAMGAYIGSDSGRAPLTVRGRYPLAAREYAMPVASAQIKSLVLLAGLNANGTTSVIEPVPTRDHTERMLKWLGADLSQDENKISVLGSSILSARSIIVPSDISSAAFFIVGAACLEGSDVLIKNVGLNPTRTAVIDVMRRLGADIKVTNKREENNEPIGDIRVTGGLNPTTENVIRGTVIANLIDELPVLAVLGTQLGNGLEIRDAGELRVKESDRISAVVENLGRMGAAVEEFADGFRIVKSRLIGATVESFGDHRIAMAFAIAALMADGPTKIDGAECAAVSFPNFFEVLDGVVKQ